jgi:hypothetical protein
MTRFVQVREARQLFRDVDADAVHRHFLTNALRRFLARDDRRAAFRRREAKRFLQPLDELLLMFRDQLGTSGVMRARRSPPFR